MLFSARKLVRDLCSLVDVSECCSGEAWLIRGFGVSEVLFEGGDYAGLLMWCWIMFVWSFLGILYIPLLNEETDVLWRSSQRFTSRLCKQIMQISPIDSGCEVLIKGRMHCPQTAINGVHDCRPFFRESLWYMVVLASFSRGEKYRFPFFSFLPRNI